MVASLLLQKIKFYRNLLYGFYFLNIASLISSVVLIIGLYNRYGELHTELILSACGIVLFGVVLPYLMVLKIKLQITDLRLEVEKQVQSWVRGWFETYRQYGDQAFKNSEFWLKIVMLTLEQSSHYTSHPAVYVAAEVSRIVRLEMENPTNKK